jgi:hypothetical protein
MRPDERLKAWMLPHAYKEEGDEVSYRFCQTNVTLRYEGDDDGRFVDIVSLVAVRQGQGDGTQCLRILTGMADIFGVKLALYARAMDDKPHSTNRLVEWYIRHGFQSAAGTTHITENERRGKPKRFAWQKIDADPDEIDADHHGLDMWRPVRTVEASRMPRAHTQ